jgi:hypothetical protein
MILRTELHFIFNAEVHEALSIRYRRLTRKTEDSELEQDHWMDADDSEYWNSQAY